LHLDVASHEACAVRSGQAERIPFSLGYRGVAISAGINPAYNALDPYCMAWAAVDEAFRNCVAVGADPEQVSLLDNFCWGNPTLPDRLGSLVRCAEGCYDAAVAYGAPFVSGKDSLNNEYTGADGQKHSIPGTLLISAMGIVPDVRRTVTSDLKAAGDLVYAVGLTGDELGGSAYYALRGELGRNVPQPPPHGLELYRTLHTAIAGGLVNACHDPSEGGLAVAAAEMALAGGLGLELDLALVPQASADLHPEAAAFGESLGRFLVEVAPQHSAAFEACMGGQPARQVGRVRADERLVIRAGERGVLISAGLDEIEQAWRGHVR
jgi:phosphoribosylformylglycinamidine synthase